MVKLLRIVIGATLVNTVGMSSYVPEKISELLVFRNTHSGTIISQMADDDNNTAAEELHVKVEEIG
jgi:hypothetical protein